MQRFIVVLLVICLLASLFPPPRFAFAATFVDDTQSEFASGTHSGSAWDTDRIQMSAGNTSATFTSQVFDGGATSATRWDNIAWSEAQGTTEVIGVDTTADIWTSVGSGSSWSIAKDDYNGGNANDADDMAVDGNKQLYVLHGQDVWKSTDRGVTWTLATDDFSTSDNSAGLFITTDSSNNIYIVTAAEDIWKSTDGGATFSSVASNINGSNGNILGLAHVGANLFAVDNKADVWRSTDSGVTWSAQNTNFNGSISDGDTDEMTADSSGNLFILDNQDIWKSTDSGATWTLASDDYNGSETQNATEITGDAGATLFIAESDEDIWKSIDNGATWTKVGTNVNGAAGNFMGLTAITVSADVTFQVRSGSVNPPTGNFVGPDGTTGTSFTTPGGEAITVSNNRYFQYRASFSSDSASYSPTVASVTLTYASVEAVSGTASSNTAWLKGASTGQNIVLTVTNAATSSAAVAWVRFTRPSASYTLTAGSASGWSAAVTASTATFTGGSIAAGDSKAFTVTVNAGSTDDAAAAWTASLDDLSDGSSTVNAAPASSGALNTGIDATAPTSVSISSAAANSETQITATAAIATDAGSGLHATPYWFDETTAGPGATDSTVWQTSASFVDTGLTTQTQYCYTVKARDAVGNESTASTAVCATTTATPQDTTAPAAVTNLAAGTPANTSMSLTWSAPGDDNGTGTSTSYDIRYATTQITSSTWSSASTATGEPTPKVAGSSESFTVSGLSSATGYYFALKTKDEQGNESGLSNIANATTTGVADITAPTISNLLATSITSSSATITWTTDESAQSEVEYGPTAAYGFSNSDTALKTSHSRTLTGLSPNTTYNYRVKSRDASSNLATSANTSFTTSPASTDGGVSGGAGDTSGPIISDIAATSTETTVIITWKTHEGGTARVEYGETKGYGKTTKETGYFANDHRIFIEGLEPEKEYHYRVASADLLNNATFSEDRTFTTLKAVPLGPPSPPPLPPAPPPPVFDAISVVSVRPTSVKITWTTDIAATSQLVFGTKTAEYNIITREFASLATSHDRTLSDLTPGTTYYFQIIARNERGIEAKSAEGTFTTESIEIQTIVQIEKPLALAPGSPGTQTPITAPGETTAAIPILETLGDTLHPTVVLFDFDENPTQDTSPTIRGRAKDTQGVIEGVSYSSDGGATWHPVTDITGIGSSAAHFTANIPNLLDGNYVILFRARDNSENKGVSESRTLIIDIKPPATGATVLLLGSQSVAGEAFGTVQTLAGIAQRFVTTAIGGATAVSMLAQKQDPARSEPPSSLLFSRQATKTPAPSSRATGIITITNTSTEEVRLIEKTRFQAPSGFIYRISKAIDIPPGTIDVAVTSDANGDAYNLTEGALSIPGLAGTVLAESLSATVKTPIAVSVPETAPFPSVSDTLEFPLVYSKAQGVWFGDVVLPDPGTYQTYVFAVDGGGRESLRPLNEVEVATPGVVSFEKDNAPIQGATVTVFQHLPEFDTYESWPGEIFNQANPQITNEKGEYRFILPPGTYYIKVEHPAYKTTYSTILTLIKHQTINFVFSLKKRRLPAHISLPFIGVKISLPRLPHFFGAPSAKAAEKKPDPPKAISRLIGKYAPLFSLPDAQTKELVDIRYLRGKKTILSTWSTWSPQAQLQIPILDSIAKKHSTDVRVLLLSLQESSGVVETYLRRGNYTIPSVVDTEGILTTVYPIFSLPQHFFIDRKGIVRDVHIGLLDHESLEKKLEQL